MLAELCKNHLKMAVPFRWHHVAAWLKPGAYTLPNELSAPRRPLRLCVVFVLSDLNSDGARKDRRLTIRP